MLALGLTLLLLSQAICNPMFDIKANDVTEDEYDGYRLPSSQIPSRYKIDISLDKTIFEGKSSDFTGTVEVTFKLNNATSSIQLHANSTMIIGNVTLTPSDATVKNKSINETTSILTLELTANLKANTEYVLKIPYTGQIDLKTMSGLYRSRYTDNDNVTQYLLSTQFEPTYARQAFPCFDEPGFKATFLISITYPKELNAISNTPLNGDLVPVQTDYVKATFKETPIMSTYLIAFIISKFTCTSAANIEAQVPHTICSTPETESQRDLAVQYSTTILNALANYTGIKYSKHLSKMTQAALPDFSAGAMENWGLVTYRERVLLWDKDESTSLSRQSILSVIAHEFTHQWFGDYVTCSWWDNIFLNEGFATYFETFIFAQIPELNELELDKQFIVAQLQAAFVEDASNSSDAITSKAASPEQIQAKFSLINYQKAGSVIRMMEHIVTSEKFKLALSNYLNTKEHSNAEPKDLLNALEEQAPEENLPKGVTFSKVMDNWINIAGYPVVTVSNDGDRIVLEQKRFLFNKSIETNSTWYIPITYTQETDEDPFTNLTPQEWLTTEKQYLTRNLTNTSSWIILNNQESAFYRVNYNEELWNRLAVALSENHTDIHVLNRAQIADDSLNLARAGLLTYSKALRILEYLKHETDYYPWKSALTALKYVVTRIGPNSDLGKSLQKMLLTNLDAAYKSVDFESDDEKEHIYILKQNLILAAACEFGHDDCISNAVSKFGALRKNGTKFDNNLKSIIYCNGLRYSSDSKGDWDFLWEKYQKAKVSSEMTTILSALGCAKDVGVLKTYLNYTVDPSSGIRYQDFTSAWSSVISSPEGVQAALEYITQEHKKLKAYSPTAASLLSTIAAGISTQEQLQKLEEFVNMEDIDKSYQDAGKKAIQAASDNLEWSESITNDLKSYLSPSSGGATTMKSISSIILIGFVTIKFLLL